MNSKLVLGLLAGVAIGAAAVYFASGRDTDDLMEELNDMADSTRDTIKDKFNRFAGKEEAAVDELAR